MPLRETAFQGYTFLALMYVGFLSAFLYDLSAPGMNSRSWLVRAGVDILLCTATTLMSFAALTLTGCGTLRLYMALALLAGALIYRFGFRALGKGFINLFRRNRKSGPDGE